MWLDGERIDHLRPEQRGFGMVFQNYALFPHMTVFGNVAFGLQLQRRPAAEIAERVRAMLELVQLPGFEARYPGQLSGGQQQRVAIARALILQPRLLLLDEPLSNLDAKLRVEMRAEIKRLHATLGLTCIYVTHDQTEALSLSDWMVLLRDGVLMQEGPPAEIHDRPDSVFVADFMGFRNFFPGAGRHRRRRRRRGGGGPAACASAGARVMPSPRGRRRGGHSPRRRAARPRGRRRQHLPAARSRSSSTSGERTKRS